MKNLYLQFTDEAHCRSVLYDGDVPRYRNIDVIGTIRRATGEITMVDGVETPIMESLPGFHVNVFVTDEEDDVALEPFSVQPRNPVRVWA